MGLLYLAAVRNDSYQGLIRRVCRQSSRRGYIPPDLVGSHSLMRVVSLSCAVLYGQIQASAEDTSAIGTVVRPVGYLSRS